MKFDTTELLAKMFPYPNIYQGRGGCEVNGLPKDALPHGRVVMTFTPDFERDHTFYLMETPEGIFVLLRICKAMEGSAYSRFAVIHKMASNPAAIIDIKATAIRWAGRI